MNVVEIDVHNIVTEERRRCCVYVVRKHCDGFTASCLIIYMVLFFGCFSLVSNSDKQVLVG